MSRLKRMDNFLAFLRQLCSYNQDSKKSAKMASKIVDAERESFSYNKKT